MKNSLKQELSTWGEELSTYSFPRWNELPEIDYYMDQVIEFTEHRLSYFVVEDSGKLITPSIINNYVKQKIIPPPIKKRYSREHIALLLIICVLKPSIPISSIQSLINIQLETHSLEEIYNNFCSIQETTTLKTIAELNSYISSIPNEFETSSDKLSILAMRMAIESSSSKLITDKLTLLNKQHSNLLEK